MKTKVNGAPAAIAESLHKGAGNFEVVRLTDGRVAYVFDPKQKVGPSKSGKTTLISTTAGALNLPGLPTISANIFQ